MSERLEQWKAREKIRADIGWVGVYVGIVGALLLLFGIGDAFGVTEVRIHVLGFDLPLPWSAVFGCVFGSALLVCAFGLWQTKVWARWAALILFGSVLVNDVVSAVALFATVYLLLPATAQRFARTRGLAESERALRAAQRR